MQITEFEFFGKDARLDHIGIVVKSIDDVLKNAKSVVDPIQNVRIAFVKLNGMVYELVEPISEDSPVNHYLDNRQTFYHVCYRVSNLDEAIQTGKRNGFHRISKPAPAKAFDNRKIVWLFHKVYGLFELVEDE